MVGKSAKFWVCVCASDLHISRPVSTHILHNRRPLFSSHVTLIKRTFMLVRLHDQAVHIFNIDVSKKWMPWCDYKYFLFAWWIVIGHSINILQTTSSSRLCLLINIRLLHHYFYRYKSSVYAWFEAYYLNLLTSKKTIIFNCAIQWNSAQKIQTKAGKVNVKLKRILYGKRCVGLLVVGPKKKWWEL